MVEVGGREKGERIKTKFIALPVFGALGFSQGYADPEIVRNREREEARELGGSVSMRADD